MFINFNSKPKLPISKTDFGFTIIELLVFVSILLVVLTISFSFLLTTFRNSDKTEALDEVRQNGDYALVAMERFITSAKKVECISSESIKVTMLDGAATLFSCTGGKIASASSNLTNNQVIVSSCNFTCTVTAGVPVMVGIGFSVSTVGVDLKSSEKASLSFSSKIVVRNQK